MPTQIDLRKVSYSWRPSDKTILVSEKDVPFATTYEVISDRTGNRMDFDFSHSTGPEFDPRTEWVYKSNHDITLRVCNDPETTRKNAEFYLKAKM